MKRQLLVLILLFCTSYSNEWTISQSMINDNSLMRPIINSKKYYNPVNYSYSEFDEITGFIKGRFYNFNEYESNFYHPDSVIEKSKNLRIQWVGHSCFLIQLDDINILTDPVFDDFYPFLNTTLYKRQIPPGIKLEDLPKIDFIIISHNHYDHLEENAILHIAKDQPYVLIPKGLKSFFSERGYKNIIESTWWEKTSFKNKKYNETFCCVPAIHESMKRDWMKKNTSLWCGWIISNKNHVLYFAGDTAFNEDLLYQIKKHFSVDIAFLPISPLNFNDKHMDPKQAIEAFNILQAKTLIPIHWGSYRYNNEKLSDPINELLNNFKNKDKSKCLHLKNGQAYNFKH